MRLLDGAENMFGKLDAALVARIQAFLDAPTVDTWDRCHSILIRPFVTVWQAATYVDPTLARISKPYAWDGKAPTPAERWARCPDALTVARGIKAALAKGAR